MSITQEYFQPPAFPEMGDDIQPLMQRLSYDATGVPPRVITFIAARSGEGTSTVAWNYAQALVKNGQRKVLVIDAGSSDAKLSGDGPGLVDNAVEGAPLAAAAHALERELHAARWLTQAANSSQTGRLLQTAQFWQELFQTFDKIIIDAPALQSAYDGVALAVHADAVVMVIEAETTPVPVTENLRTVLQSSGAKILGVVMNKRRYYIPDKTYRRL